jgi:hypothetical protein
MKTKQQRKDEAWKEYLKIEQTALKEYEKIQEPAFEEYQKKCAEIDNEEGTEIIHNGKRYRLVEE